MEKIECAYYADMVNGLGEDFATKYPPCKLDKAAIDAFIKELNALLATEPNAISAHLKALQKSSGCLVLSSNSEQKPVDVPVLIENTRTMGTCTAIKYLPKKVG